MNDITFYKKILVSLLVITVASVVAIHHKDIFLYIKNLEMLSKDNVVTTSLVIILLKTIAAPLGIPGTPITLIVGSLLGTYVGTIVSIIGNTLGATLAFLLSRYILRDYIQKSILPKYPTIKKYERRLESNSLQTIITLRLIPLFPFNILNFILGVTNVPIQKYVIGSFVGMIPGTFMYVYFGESIRMLSPINIILAMVGLLLLIYLGKQYGKHS